MESGVSSASGPQVIILTNLIPLSHPLIFWKGWESFEVRIGKRCNSQEHCEVKRDCLLIRHVGLVTS